MKLTLLIAAVAAVALAVPSSASAGTLTLHPSGFGTMSYSSWKAQQGEPDSGGSANQALYFQKMTLTPTPAAGVAIVRGIEGLPASDLEGLAWDHRTDGHCGFGAPRWNVGYERSDGSTGTAFFGCFAAEHQPLGSASGHGWCRDTYSSAAIDNQLPDDATITSLAIIFDEGNDTPNVPPVPCEQEQPQGGFVHLDNITVTTSSGPNVWTSARDNGNG